MDSKDNLFENGSQNMDTKKSLKKVNLNNLV